MLLRRATKADLLVVGLGNPGSNYERTRHNVGFDVVDELARRHGGKLKLHKKERALVDEVTVGGRRIALAAPTTFMNLSGEAVRPLVRRFDIEDLHRLVIVQDELDLPVGRIKIKIGGGLAGHNGLKAVKAGLGSPDFWRIRAGVGRPDSTDPEIVSAHVLGRFSESQEDVRELVERAADELDRLVASAPSPERRE